MTSNGARRVVVVIATYNEADTIDWLLCELRDYKVVLIDDNSPDETWKRASRHPNVHVVNRLNTRGIASAYQLGMELALAFQPKYVVQMDAGGTHNPDDVARMLGVAGVWDYDLVIGSRFYPRPKIDNNRTLISMTAAWLMRLLGVHVRDATSGFRCWKHETLRQVLKARCVSEGFAFQLEHLWSAHQAGAHITELSIEYKLTNSSFKLGMLVEAMKVYGGFVYDYIFHHPSGRVKAHEGTTAGSEILEESSAKEPGHPVRG